MFGVAAGLSHIGSAFSSLIKEKRGRENKNNTAIFMKYTKIQGKRFFETG